MIHVPMIRETIATQSRNQVLDVTPQVQRLVATHKLRTGMVVVFVPHTTAAVTINENADPDVKHDFLAKLAELIPVRESYYDHGEGNSDAHVKTAAVGNSATLLVEAGKLMLGRWQGVYFCEFDGPRERQIWIKLVDFGE
jgi:secondary thiamine-phosphate synthase enzyme